MCGWMLSTVPLELTFFSAGSGVIGSNPDLADVIEDITGISDEALLHVKSLDEFSVAQRLSWASLRQTEREEDWAYSLMGIFGINMPTLQRGQARLPTSAEGDHAAHSPLEPLRVGRCAGSS